MIAEGSIDKLIAWLAEMGLNGAAEETLVHGFCERAADAGVPISRALMLIDTLHPVYEGRLMRWGHDPSLPAVVEYGRTVLPEGAADTMSEAEREEAARRWRESPFFHMLESGESLLRLTAESAEKFPIMNDHIAAGMKSGIAIINRFAPQGVIGDMDCVYSTWMTTRAEGFDEAHIDALARSVPTLALAVKAATLTRMTATLMETYLGRDAARRVLSGRIMRGVADRIDAVIWFSDLRGFTRVTDTAPEQVIPLLDDYAEVIVPAIHTQGGDVLKLIGDGILAIFTAEDRERACAAALDAATAVRKEVIVLNARRGGEGLPVTDMYLGLHVG